MKGLLKALAVLSVFHLQPIFAQETKQDFHALAKSSEWLRLLRYERSFFGLSKKTSAVNDNDFFFSPSGKSDSYSELLETVKAFNLPPEKFGNPDKHPVCRFPARFKWLKKQIKSLASQDNISSSCPGYNKWRADGKITSISIYFATGYFGNPASFFGHPLLKFNVGNGDSQLVDSSLNYGAITPDKENPVLYVFKGLFGGYHASFTRHDFFYHNHNYSETEMRDLWEYRLNLEPNEIEYIVDSTWELLGRNHPYYFLLDNCAYRMAELLEHVFDQQLLFRNGLYIIPIDLFTNLANAKRSDGRAVVSKISRVPSRYSRLSEMYNLLSESEQNLVKSAVYKPTLLNEKNFIELPEGEKAKVVDTLINYYSFLKLKKPDSTEYDQQRTNLIRERFKIPTVSNFEDNQANKITPPHLAQNSFNLQVANVHSNNGTWFQELNIRPALYDELNPSIGRPNNTSLVVFDTRFRFRNDKFSLRSLDFFRVSTLNTPNTDLPEDGNLSWKVQLGLKSQSQLCENCLVGNFSGGLGLARSLFYGTSAYALIKAGLQNSRNDQGTLYGGPEIGTYIEPFSWWKILLSYELEAFQNGLETKTDIYKFEQRLGTSQYWDFRLEYQQRDDKQLRFTVSWYL